MPSLNISPPSPSPLPAPMPPAAKPNSSGDSAPPGGFSALIEDKAAEQNCEAAAKAPTGNALPPKRPALADGTAPTPVEDIMVGAAPHAKLPAQGAPPPPAAAADLAALEGDEESPGLKKDSAPDDSETDGEAPVVDPSLLQLVGCGFDPVGKEPARFVGGGLSARARSFMQAAGPRAEQPSPAPSLTGQPGAAAANPNASAPANFNITADLARQIADLIRPAGKTDGEPASAAAASLPGEALPTLQPTAIAAPAQAGAANILHRAIDTGRADWIQSMIDRIAEMPHSDRREAQIRLSPDALGAVEVRIVERNDRMQVTLNADTAQARQLLSDAAPRLAELAEARGLRFGQTGVGGGEAQDRRDAREQPEAPLRPRPPVSKPDAESQPDRELIA